MWRESKNYELGMWVQDTKRRFLWGDAIKHKNLIRFLVWSIYFQLLFVEKVSICENKFPAGKNSYFKNFFIFFIFLIMSLNEEKETFLYFVFLEISTGDNISFKCLRHIMSCQEGEKSLFRFLFFCCLLSLYLRDYFSFIFSFIQFCFS